MRPLRSRLVAVVLALSVVAACAAPDSRSAVTPAKAGAQGATPSAELDDFGDTVAIGAPPARVVSLNPATTELMFALDAGSRLVGRTHWDEWPEAAKLVPDMGDGLRPNLEAVLATRPDLVILYASDDNRQAALRLRAAGVSTLSLRVDLPSHFHRATMLLGRILGDTVRARAVIDTADRKLAEVRARTAALPHPTVCWVVDLRPLLIIGGGSFLNVMIETAGGTNVYAATTAPSAPASLEDLLRKDPDVIVADSGLAAAILRESTWRTLRAVREGRVIAADPILMGRPSVRMGEGAAALATLLHPATP